MHEVQLNLGPKKTILTFHANTLEYFSAMSAEGGMSIHVGHLKSIEISTDKKGKRSLTAKTELHSYDSEVSEQALPKARELVAAAQEAMKTIKL